ncbi:MAG: acyl-CoA dehydrogenase family protein [Novosphingobium sp.]
MITKQELVGRAREIAPMVAANAENDDITGKVSDAVVDAFCDAGFMKIFVPKVYGGYEMEPDVMAAVVKEISPYSTSAAWILAFYIGHNFLHALFPKQSQDEVFAPRGFSLTPGTSAPSFKLTPVEGGYIARGKSSWNSGAARADWYMNGGMVEGAEKPELLLFMAPASDVEVTGNWDVAGMRATSSCDIVINDAFVPHHQCAPAAEILEGRSPGAKVHTNPMYSMPMVPLIQCEVLPVIVGAFQGAVREFHTLTRQRIQAHTSEKSSEKQSAQIRLGKVLTDSALADDMLHNYIDLVINMDKEEIKTVEARAAIRARVAGITDFCANGVNEVMKGSGASAFRNDSPLQRIFRDINMLRVHGYLDLETGSQALGRVALGMPPQCVV